jgi:hypothetical protein
MPRIGQRAWGLIADPQARQILGWVALGSLSAALPALWMRGFTVDDALISVRYARHLAQGDGWRFNAGGPSTDGVTPLPWPLLLAPLARAAPLDVLARAEAVGFVASVVAGGCLGRAVGAAREAPVWARAAVLLVAALSVPSAAYSVSGMETPLATLLATAAVVSRTPWTSAVTAGLAAALRPEMGAWAVTLAVALDTAERRALDLRAVGLGAIAVAPFALCALVRAIAWGRPAPLAVLAKPSGVELGVAYTGAGLVVTLLPLLVVAPLALGRSPRAAAIVAAAAVHVLAIVAVGGDWMPYARLFVPILPSLALAACLAGGQARALFTAARSACAIAVGVVLIARGGTSGRAVAADRERLIASARPWLADVRRVAALDVGWVGAATEADIVDLAGLTDPEIAALPGGHTSKRVGAMFLLSRSPDALLLYAPGGLPGGSLDAWRDAAYPRAVEARLAHDAVVARHFAPVAWLALGSSGAGYVLLRSADRP